MRKLNVWGGIILVLWVVNFIGPSLVSDEASIGIVSVMGLIFLGLEIFLGIKGNEMTAKNYLENGWIFMDDDSDITKFAKSQWGIAG